MVVTANGTGYKFTLTVEGMSYDIEVNGDTVLVSGRPYTVTVEGNTVTIEGIPHTVELNGEQAVIDGITIPFTAVSYTNLTLPTKA